MSSLENGIQSLSIDSLDLWPRDPKTQYGSFKKFDSKSIAISSKGLTIWFTLKPIGQSFLSN